MEVVSTSNSVSSENERKTVCNFQTMAMNYFVIRYDWPNGNLCIYALYANIKLLVVSL